MIRIIVSGILLSMSTVPVWAQRHTDSMASAIELSEVQVTGWRDPFGQQYHQSNELQQATDRLLERIKGVTMIRRGNFAMEPTLRGLSAAQINTTIDGMQLFGACTDRMDPVSSYIEPNNLNSVQLGFSPNGGQYGTSVGGGLNFRLRQAHTGAAQTWSGMAGAGYETNARASQTIAALQYSRARFAWSVNGVWRRADNYTAGKGVEIPFSQYHKWNLGLSTVYRLRNDDELRVDYLQDEGRDIGYPALTMDVSFANAKIASASYIRRPKSGRLQYWETKLYYNYIDHAMDDTKRPAWQVPIHMDMPGTSQTMGFYSKTYWALSPAHRLEAQINAYDNKLHAEMTMYPDHAAEMFMLTLPDVQRSVAGLDLKDKITISEQWHMALSLTMNYVRSGIYSQLGEQTLSSLFEGSLGRQQLLWNAGLQTDYRINPHWMAYASVSRGARSASAQELYAFYLFNRMDNHDYLGNKDLRPETSLNGSLGLVFQQQAWYIEPQVFAYRFADYIVGRRLQGYSTMTIGASGVKQYVNIPDALLYGGELTLRYKPLPSLQLQSVNTISIGRDDQQNSLPLVPPFKSVNRVDYTLAQCGLYVEAISQARQNRVSTDLYGERPSAGFTIWNAGIGRNFTLGKNRLNAHLAVNNIGDRQYYEHLDIMKIFRPGRNWVFNLNWTF